MATAVRIIGFVNLALFAVLAAVAVSQWRSRQDRASLWAALAFAALGGVVVAARVLPRDANGVGQLAVNLEIALLVLFPYLLYRFGTIFRPPPRRLERLVGAATALVTTWTLVLPDVPEPDEPRPWWFVAYVGAFVAHWSALSVVVAVRLWRAGRGQPGVARRRMRLLALAASLLTLAIVIAAANPDRGSAVALVQALLGFGGGLAFVVGLAPPTLLRLAWSEPERRRLQESMERLVALATSERELAERVLGPAADLVGAQAVALRDAAGAEIAAHRVPDGDAGAPIEVELPGGGSLVVWTAPEAPFFGADELQRLRTLGALTGIALDRVRLFAREHDARLALERADELKTNFVALAAHELRTPVTAVKGVAETLVAHGHRLGEADRRELERALISQASRLATLVEQLLDLSRLDAEAIEIQPAAIALRHHVEEVVSASAEGRGADVLVDVPPELVASVDAHVLDRILSNLVVNALRYGAPPVTVSASASDRHLRVAVEDRGSGVAPEFVPDLFERFTRSDPSRARGGGTGLGLAIARSYARAHGGELLYTDAQPHGARFELVLPGTAERAREESNLRPAD